MIDKIASDVSNKLNNSRPSSDFERLVGMESHMTNMGPILQLDLEEVRIIGIWGQSGIGKTTIARFLYNRYSQNFDLSVFVDNIRTRYPTPICSDDYSVKKKLQERFMSKLTNEKDSKIPHLGTIKDRLKDKKVLIVLDDVDQLIQLEAMANKPWWFGPSSRIIITTQDRRLLQAHGVNHTYKVNFPSSTEALQMFCMYAFDQKSPKDGFRELDWEVTRLVGELPLGISIMGSYFRGMFVQHWSMALPRLRTSLNGKIENILMFSYDVLCDEDKDLFLHIACFFENESVDILEGCLAYSFPDVKYGLHVLTEKSLISSNYGIIKMHELLVQLGREIVRRQSSQPGERQFLVDDRDTVKVLNDNKVDVSKVLGLHMLSYHDSESLYEGVTRERAFERFCNLHFLRVDEECRKMPFFLTNLKCYPELRYLSWHSFRMRCFPSGFQTKFLVKLNIWFGKLEKLWEGIQPLNNLKWMSLCYLKRLEEVPDLSTATNLCELDLSGCSNLVNLPSSIGNAISLKVLNLTKCSSLVELPSSMKNLRKLSDLILEGCPELEVNLTNINLESLEELDLSECSSLKCHPETSTSIEDLKPSGTAVKEASSSSMKPSSELEISNSEIQVPDPWIGRISILRRLILYRMKKTVSLPQLPYSVTQLDAYYCEPLKILD